MNLTKLDKLVRLQTQLISNQHNSRMDSAYSMSEAINEISKAIKAELLKPDEEVSS